jgi:hypothetical protein
MHQSVERGHALKDLIDEVNDSNERLFLQMEVASIITCAQERNDRWFELAMDQFGVSERMLRHYLAHGNSVLLANLTQIARKFYDGIVKADVPYFDPSWLALKLLTQFDPRNTLPELQDGFCALWNEIVQTAQKDENKLSPFFILYTIRHIYIALHQDTIMHTPAFATSTDPYDDIFFKASSYALCNTPGHCRQHLSPQPSEVRNQGTISSMATAPPTIAHHISTSESLALARSTRLGLYPFPVPDPDYTNTSLHPAEESLLDRDHLAPATSGMITSRAIKGTTVISSPASPKPRSTPRQSVVPQQTGLSFITPHPIISSVPPAPILMQTFSGAVPRELLPSSDPTAVRSDYVSQELELAHPPSVSTSAVLSAAQAASASYPDVSTRTANLCSSGHSQNLNLLSPVGLLRSQNPSRLSVPDIAMATLQSNDDRSPSEYLDHQNGQS